jgi:hypothetical protein
LLIRKLSISNQPNTGKPDVWLGLPSLCVARTPDRSPWSRPWCGKEERELSAQRVGERNDCVKRQVRLTRLDALHLPRTATHLLGELLLGEVQLAAKLSHPVTQEGFRLPRRNFCHGAEYRRTA